MKNYSQYQGNYHYSGAKTIFVLFTSIVVLLSVSSIL